MNVPPLPEGEPLDPFGAAAALARLLAVHVPVDEREARSLDQFRSELDRLPRPFDRFADLTHVTSSGVVIGVRGVLLHRHRRLHRWMQPGGHVEPGERPEDAAVRECREETGLDVAHPVAGPVLIHVDVHQAAANHTHLDLRYLLDGPDSDPAPPPDESPDVAWFTWEDAESTSDVALRGALQAAYQAVFQAVERPPSRAIAGSSAPDTER